MQSIIVIILVGLAGGVAVGLQGPLTSLMTQRIGVFESIFIVHLGGAMFALVPLLIIGGGRIGQWRSVPWYALCAGLSGLVVLSAVSYIIPRLGVVVSVITVVAGQLAVGTLLDQFGLLGGSGRPLDATRVLGLVCVMAGVWLTVK